jgi:hypothetical protein
VNVEDRDRGAVRAQGGDGDVAQPGGFFDQRAGGIVLAEQVAGLVVGVEHGAVGAAADLNPLAEGVLVGVATWIQLANRLLRVRPTFYCHPELLSLS